MIRWKTVKVNNYLTCLLDDNRQVIQWMAEWLSRGKSSPLRYSALLWPQHVGRLQVVDIWQRNLWPGVPLHFSPDLEIDLRDTIRLYLAGGHRAHAIGKPDADICRFCGCIDGAACDDKCWRVAPGLCSACCRRFDIDPVKRAQLTTPAEFI